MLQASQRHSRQNRNEQRLIRDGWSCCCNGIQLLRLQRKQLDRCGPNLGSQRIVSSNQSDTSRQLQAALLQGAAPPNNGQQLVSRNPTTLQKWKHKGLSHAAQTDYTESWLHRRIQRAAAPQAGEGALEDSPASATSASRLTTVGAEASSWPVLVTVTQLGANRKMLSPTRS